VAERGQQRRWGGSWLLDRRGPPSAERLAQQGRTLSNEGACRHIKEANGFQTPEESGPLITKQLRLHRSVLFGSPQNGMRSPSRVRTSVACSIALIASKSA